MDKSKASSQAARSELLTSDYAAFISYSHADDKVGEWFQKRLEDYRVPGPIVGRDGPAGPISKRLGKVFRDRVDLAARNDLGAEIRRALDQSKALIVLCSPRSAASGYVRDEILYFKKLGRTQSIFAVIIDGEPHAAGKPGWTSADECFPPALIYRTNADGTLSSIPEHTEPIAADVREGKDGRENGALKIIAGLLGVDLDELIQREKQAERARRFRAYVLAAAMAGLALAAGGAGYFAYLQRNVAIASQREAEQQRDNARATLGQMFEARIWDALNEGRIARAARYALAGATFAEGLPDEMRVALNARYESGLAAAVYRFHRAELLAEHEAPVTAVAYGRDGAFASLSSDGVLRLWQAASAQTPVRIAAHASGSGILVFSPDQRLIASASGGSEITLRNGRTGEVQYRLTEESPSYVLNPVVAAAFSPDGRLFAASLDLSGPSVWDTASGALLHYIGRNAQRGQARALAFSPDGRRLATAASDGSVYVWAAEDGARLGEMHLPSGMDAASVAFSPDGTLIAAGGYNLAILWNASTYQPLATLPSDDKSSGCLAFSPDSQRLAVCGGAGVGGARLWSRDGSLVTDLILDHSWVGNVMFSPKGELIATTNGLGDARLWNEGSGKLVAELLGNEDPISSIAFSPDGSALLTGARDGALRRWLTRTPLDLLTLDGHGRQFAALAYSPDGKRIATSGYDNVVRLWDGVTGAPLAQMPGHSDLPWRLAFSEDSAVLASGDFDGRVLIWDGRTGARLGALPERANASASSSNTVRTLAFVPGGRGVIRIIGDEATLTDWRSGKERTLAGYWSSGGVAAFSPDARTYAESVRSDGSIELYDTFRARTFSPLPGVGESAVALTFSADGRLLAGSFRDRTIRIRALSRDRPDLVLHEHLVETRGLAFSSDGRRLAVGAEGGVHVYDVGSGRLLQIVPTATTGRNVVEKVAFSPDGARLLAADADRAYLLGISALTARWSWLAREACDYLSSQQERFRDDEIDTDPLIRDVWLKDGRDATSSVCEPVARG